MKDIRKLEVWEKSHQLALAIYAMTAKFPKEEFYGLTNQIRRAAVSVPTNIAEGCGRGSDADFARFLQIATGSASEVEDELMLAKDLRYIPAPLHVEIERQAQAVKQMLAAFLRTLHQKNEQCTGNSGGKRIAESEFLYA